MVTIVLVDRRNVYLPNTLGMKVLLRTRCFHGHGCSASHHSHHKKYSCGREMNQIAWGTEIDGVAVGKGLCVRNGTPETPPTAHMPCCRVTLLPAGSWSREFWFYFLVFVCSGGVCCVLGVTLVSYAPLRFFHIDIDISADLFNLFVGCLPTLSVIQTGQCRMIDWLIVNNEVERLWEKPIMSLFMALFFYLRNWRKSQKLINYSWFSGQDSNPAPAEYKSEGLLF